MHRNGGRGISGTSHYRYTRHDICDYADPNRNDYWQEHAAVAAAACTKELLGLIEPTTVTEIDTSKREFQLKFEEEIDIPMTLKQNVYGDEDRKILEWMTSIDDGSQHNDNISRRQAGNGEWLLNSTEYRHWINTAKETLFCPGMPGAGKTILASVVVDHLIDRYFYNPTIGVAYIYFNFKASADIEVDELLST
ncbi:hypothetical protein TWF506_007506 [Arthrobotrys conoides]|uniref:Nephrocystin 3-like N-terminal domain-containing protein n=1 Tax=Arthrobotrys conoides TaxID=74498 RepID=A0AAN8NKD6_9PEZI